MPTNYRAFTGTISANGSGTVTIQNGNAATEWDIFQISTQCGSIQANCIVILYVNGNFLCATPQGSLDTAYGPPNVILRSTDVLTAVWSNGFPADPLTVGIWYNENPVGQSPVGAQN